MQLLLIALVSVDFEANLSAARVILCAQHPFIIPSASPRCYAPTMGRDIRSKALERIAALSASQSTALFEKSDLDRLCRACSSHGKGIGKTGTNGSASVKSQSLGRVPMVRATTPTP